MNIKLLRQIKAIFKQEPKRLSMGSWLYNEDSNKGPECGTVGCISGWACCLSAEGKTIQERRKEVENGRFNFFGRGRRLLGLTYDQAVRLFFTDEWPGDFEHRYNTAHTPRKRMEVTCERIEHFIKTKGKE